MAFQRGDKVVVKRNDGHYVGSVSKVEEEMIYITQDNGSKIKYKENSTSIQPAQNKFRKAAIPESRLSDFLLAITPPPVKPKTIRTPAPEQTVRFGAGGELPIAGTTSPKKVLTLDELVENLYGSSLLGFVKAKSDYVWTKTGGSRSFFDKRFTKIKNGGRFLEITYKEKATRVATVISSTYCNGNQLALIEAKIYQNSPANSTYEIRIRDLTHEEVVEYRNKITKLQKKTEPRVKPRTVNTAQQIEKVAEKRRQKAVDLTMAPKLIIKPKEVKRPS